MNSAKKAFSTVASKRLLYTIVFTLVFEGVFRKLSPAAVSTGLFFLKDLLCLFGCYIVLNTHASKLTRSLMSLWGKILLALLPLILYTFFLSPPLSLFGAKQYLLYLVIALLVPIAFPKENIEEFKRFLFFIAFLLLPTSLVAMLQNSLPATHWLNLGVEGQSLAGFSAGGKLRVSSTFSFTGQYSFFLIMASVVFAASYFMQPQYKSKAVRRYMPVLYAILAAMIMIGNFITGGRTAVLGSGACLALGFVLTGNRYPAWFVSKGVLVIMAGIFMLSGLRIAKPEYFEAYEIRSKGSEGQSHSDEVEGRLLVSIFAWTSWFNERNVEAMIVGEGLGVMTNGSAQVSSYAANIRAGGYWTESDLATTMWEGGIYLAIVWYGMRLYVIYYCFRLCQRIKTKKYASAAYFLFGFVIVNGLIGTLSIQPPLSIWYWMMVGSIVTIQNCDAYIFKTALSKKQSAIDAQKQLQNEEIISI